MKTLSALTPGRYDELAPTHRDDVVDKLPLGVHFEAGLLRHLGLPLPGLGPGRAAVESVLHVGQLGVFSGLVPGFPLGGARRQVQCWIFSKATS